VLSVVDLLGSRFWRVGVVGEKKELVGLILAGIDASGCGSAGWVGKCVFRTDVKPTSNRHGNDIKPTVERPEATLKRRLWTQSCRAGKRVGQASVLK
jgi:hypothetical protein